MDEVEILKTLQRIEKLINQAVGSAQGGQQARVAGGRKPADATKELSDSFKSINKQLERFSDKLDDASDATGVIKGKISSVEMFGTVIGSTTKMLETLKGSMKVSASQVGQYGEAYAQQHGKLNNQLASSITTLNGLTTGFGATASSMTAAIDQQQKMIAVSKAYADQQEEAKKAEAYKLRAETVMGKRRERLQASADAKIAKLREEQESAWAKQLGDLEKKKTASAKFYDNVLKKMLGGVGYKMANVEGMLSRFEDAVGGAFKALVVFAKQVIDDAFYLQSRGISASDSLGSLYANSIKYGMSLQEYTKLLEENSAAVTRASSFEEFDKSINQTVKGLNRLGVFGASAANLAATMNTAAVTVGVPTEQMGSVIEKQTKTFEQLRKTTFMTAAAFRELIAQVSQNENVQSELLGLAPQERAARLADITNSAALGQKLGLTKDAADKLGQALINMRKATAVERFKSAAGIRQAAALTGMSSEDADELSRLRLKKNRSAEENARFVQLAGQLEQGIQQMQNSDNLATQNIADQLESNQLASIREEMKLSGLAKAQGEAGPAGANTEMGKETSPFMQAIGNLGTTIEGAMKNPLVQMVTSLGGILAQTLVEVFYLRRIAAAAEGKPLGSLFGKKAPVGAAGTVAGAGQGVLGAMSGGISAVLGGAKTLISKLATPWMAALVGGVEEAFTGNLQTAMALGDGAMGKILGVIMGAFNGIFTAIPRMFDGVVNWVLEGIGVSFKMNSTGAVEYVVSLFTDFFKMIISSAVGGLGKLIGSVFGDSVPWAKSLKETSDSIDASIIKSSENREKLGASLLNNEGKTLRDIGAEQQKQQDSQGKKLKGSVVSNVTTLDQLASSAIASIAATKTAADASPTVSSQVASPATTTQKSVTPPEVNKQQAAQGTEPATATGTVQPATTNPATLQEMLTVAQAQLQVLQRTLDFMMSKDDPMETYLKAVNRPTMTSNEQLYSTSLKVV